MKDLRRSIALTTWTTGLAVALSCGDSAPAGPDSDVPQGTERTLQSCATSIDSRASHLYATYFRCVGISVTDSVVVLSSDGLPPHRSNYYGESSPNYEAFDSSRGAEYQPNPNDLATQNFAIEIPLEPVPRGVVVTNALVDGIVGTSELEYPLGPVGMALDGVAIFNPLARPGDDIEDEKFTFDRYNAHPTMNGAYHYHTSSIGPLEVLAEIGQITRVELESAEVEFFGVMCDGTLVLGCTEIDGEKPDAAEFDAQNGHVHDIVNSLTTVIFSQRYHTHICPSRYDYKFTPEIQYYEGC